MQKKDNRFTYHDRPGHEVVFVYTGRLANADVVGPGGGTLYDNGELDLPLYPLGVSDLLPAADPAQPPHM